MNSEEEQLVALTNKLRHSIYELRRGLPSAILACTPEELELLRGELREVQIVSDRLMRKLKPLIEEQPIEEQP